MRIPIFAGIPQLIVSSSEPPCNIREIARLASNSRLLNVSI